MIKKIEEQMIKLLVEKMKKVILEGKKAGLSKRDIMLKMTYVVSEIYKNQIMDATEKEQALDTIEKVKEII